LGSLISWLLVNGQDVRRVALGGVNDIPDRDRTLVTFALMSMVLIFAVALLLDGSFA